MIRVEIITIRGPMGSGKSLIATGIAENLFRENQYNDFHLVNSISAVDRIIGDPTYRQPDDIFIIDDYTLPFESHRRTDIKFWQKFIKSDRIWL